MKTAPCRHDWTERRDDGVVCGDCHQMLLRTEPKPCGTCRHVQVIKGNACRCTKLQMMVTMQHHALYRVTDGACWEGKP